MRILIGLLVLFFISEVQAYVPTKAYTFGFNIITHGMNSRQEQKIDQSLDILRRVFASAEFKTRILQHKYNGRKTFAHNQGLTNLQIYNSILDGMEKLDRYRDNTMDVEIALFTDMTSNVLGFTKTRTKKIWVNTKYFHHRTSPANVSSHLMHEWLHKLGFGHEKQECYSRRFSVPYAIGYIVRDLAEKI